VFEWADLQCHCWQKSCWSCTPWWWVRHHRQLPHTQMRQPNILPPSNSLIINGTCGSQETQQHLASTTNTDSISITNSNKYKKKIVNLQSIGIIAIKSRKTRAVIYTCRYSKLNYRDKTSTWISAGVNDCPCFSTFYCYDPYILVAKLKIFSYACFFTFFGNDYNIGELTSATSKEMKIIFAGATPIN